MSYISPRTSKRKPHTIFFPRQRDNHKNAQECRFKNRMIKRKHGFRLRKFNQSTVQVGREFKTISMLERQRHETPHHPDILMLCKLKRMSFSLASFPSHAVNLSRLVLGLLSVLAKRVCGNFLVISLCKICQPPMPRHKSKGSTHQVQPSLLWPRRIHPPPYPHQRTSERKHVCYT